MPPSVVLATGSRRDDVLNGLDLDGFYAIIAHSRSR